MSTRIAPSDVASADSIPKFNAYGSDYLCENSRYSALKQACQSGAISSVRSILQSTDSAGLGLPQPEPLEQLHLQKCLLEAFINNNFDTARYLIREAGAEMKPIEEHLVWHASQKFMPVEAFEFLIQEGWDINSPLRHYRTALSRVLRSLPLTKWFLEHGANPNLGPDTCHLNTRKSRMVPDSGFVLGSAACTDPSTAIVLIDLLLQYGARLKDSIPLHRVAGCSPYQNNDKSVTSNTSTYLQAQSEIEINPTSATFSSRVPILQHLVNLGCDINASDKNYWGPGACGTPLQWAVSVSSMENARFLLENGADPWAKDPFGRNALEAAKRQNELRHLSGKDRLTAKLLKEALLENGLTEITGNLFIKAVEEAEAAEIEDEPLQESELEKLIERFM